MFATWAVLLALCGATPVAALWKYQTSSNVRSSPTLSADDAVVYVGSYVSYLYALSMCDTAPNVSACNCTAGHGAGAFAAPSDKSGGCYSCAAGLFKAASGRAPARAVI